MAAAEMSDFHPSITEIECCGNCNFTVRLRQVAHVNPEPLCVRGRLSGRKLGMDRFVADPRNIAERSESEGVVVVPVSDDDGS